MGGNGNGTKLATELPMVVPKHGRGKLLRGGVVGHRGAGGRTPSALREKMRGALATRIKIAQDIADDEDATSADRLRALDFLGKYGLGTTITETDTEGRDVQISVVRQPRRLVVDD